MRFPAVQQPARVPPPPAELGRLGGGLAWLAAAQGAWPPRVPGRRRDVVVGADGLVAGAAAADALVDGGADLVVIEGPAATKASFVAFCVLLAIEPVAAIGTGRRPDWAELVVAVRDALPAARAATGDPQLLADDAELGHAVGLLAQLAVRRTPVVLGGSSLLAAAALVAERMAPGASAWWLVGSPAPGEASKRGYAELDLEPLLDLGVTVSGAASLAADLLIGGISLASGLHESAADGVVQM